MIVQIVPLDGGFSLLGPDGLFVRVEGGELRFGESDGEIADASLVVRVRPGQYEVIDRDALFHLDPAVRGPNMRGRFDDVGEIEIELRLAGELVPRLAGSEVPLPELDESDPLRATESWYALNVTQQDGPVKTGYSTAWMRSHSIERSPLQVVGDALRGLGLSVLEGELEGVATVETNFKGVNGRWTCQAQFIAERGIVLFVSLLPEPASADRRGDVLDLLNRVNWWLLDGTLEMHAESGAMRLRTTQLVPEGEALTERAARDLVRTNVETLDHCLGEITRVMAGLSTAAEAERRVTG